jgi:hypothetical protein
LMHTTTAAQAERASRAGQILFVDVQKDEAMQE